MQVSVDDFRVELSDEEAALIEIARDFVRKRSDFAKVRSLIDSETGFDQAVWGEIVAMGWTGLAIPEAAGGSGLPVQAIVPIAEAFGRGLMTTPLLPTVLATEAIRTGGSAAVQQVWLSRLAKGAIGTIALREPGRGWELTRPSATATADGAGFRLQGTKLGVAFADRADVLIASVLVDGAPRLAAVERGQLAPGAIRRLRTIDETQRSFAVTLDGVTVPERAVLPDGAAVEWLYRCAVLVSVAEACGACIGALDLVIDYMKVRYQFGRPIGSFQALKHPTVDNYIDYELCRSLLYGAKSYWGEDRGWSLARMAAAKTADCLLQSADRGIQFHGGIGFTHECNAGLFLKRSIWGRAQYGDGVHFRRSLAAELL